MPRLSDDHLIKLSQKGEGVLKSSCLNGIECAENPFLPGMALSLALKKAAENALEGEQRELIAAQESIDALLLEIFERLPQTVRGFKGGMAGCSALLEPEKSTKNSATAKGPLWMSLQARHLTETFSTLPLITNFLSLKFALGLPDLRDTCGVLTNEGKLEELRFKTADGNSKGGLIAFGRDKTIAFFGKNKIFDSLLSPRGLLQGANPKFPTLTILPGAQFIVAGVIAAPNNFYMVPGMRMALDFVVYLGVLTALSYLVLLHDDGGLTQGEIAFAVYLVVSSGKDE